MYDVTDAAFRAIIAKYGKPDIFWTEFVSAEGLNSAGRERLMPHLWYSDRERPIVAQIFGSHPEAFESTARLLADLKFDGIDINLGCPDKNIMKQGSCAALFKNPKLAQQIINAAKKGAPNLPVSVKIRIGDTKVDWHDWINTLLEAQPAAITIHLRTRKEMSKVPAHWELMPDIVSFINDNAPEGERPIILGNGDVMTLQEAREKVEQTGCDGVMLGRGIFGNPWLFDRSANADSQTSLMDKKQKLAVLLEHTRLFEQTFAGAKNFEIMKKHYKAYVSGFDGAKELRAELMAAKNYPEVEKLVEKNLTA